MGGGGGGGHKDPFSAKEQLFLLFVLVISQY